MQEIEEKGLQVQASLRTYWGPCPGGLPAAAAQAIKCTERSHPTHPSLGELAEGLESTCSRKGFQLGVEQFFIQSLQMNEEGNNQHPASIRLMLCGLQSKFALMHYEYKDWTCFQHHGALMLSTE
jgi:hypothetical protein